MARVGSLFVNLALEDAAFISGLKRATKEHETAMRHISGATKIAGTALASITAAAAGLFTTQMIRNALDYAGSIGEVAQALGVTQRELQVYRFAGSQANLTNEQMEKSLGKLTLEIGRGNKAFADLGIATQNSNGGLRTAGEVLPDLADKLRTIKDPAERARVLVDIFGKSGQALGPLLAEGAAGLKTFGDEAERTGQILSDEAIANADKAADSITKFQSAISVSVAAVVAENADAIAKLADAIATLVGRIGQAVAQARQASRNAQILGANPGLKKLFDGPGEVFDIYDADARRLPKGGRGSGNIDPAGLKFGDVPAVKVQDVKIYPAATRAASAAATAKKATAEIQKTASELRMEGTIFDGPTLRGEIVTGLQLAKAEVQQIADLSATLAESAQITMFDDMRAASADVADNLAQAIVYGQDIGKALISSFKAAAAEALANGLFKLLLGEKGTSKGGLLGSVISAFTKVPATKVPAREFGGPVSAGKPYLVGERRPEIFVPSTAGRIIPNVNAVAGAGGITLNVDARGSNDPGAVQAAVVRAIEIANGYTDGRMAGAARPRMPRFAGA